MLARLPIVGVMGSGSDPHEQRSREVGRWLADEGVHLLTGGGGGVMAAVSEAFFEAPRRRGLVIGIVPAGGEPPRQPRDGYPNRWVEVPIFTHLPLSGEQGTDLGSRNHINVLSSDVLIVLPGGAGTMSEARLAVRYGRPAIAYAVAVPGLPPEIPLTDSFADVQRFVREALRRA